MDISKPIRWSPEQLKSIYQEWGLYNTKRGNLEVADFYYTKSLSLNPGDTKSLHFRSQCKRRIAQTEEALADAMKALELEEMQQLFNLEVCDGLYEMNDFEQNKCRLSSYSKKFVGNKVDAFLSRLDVVNENFKDIFGDSMEEFILENQTLFDKIGKNTLENNNAIQKSSNHISKYQQMCDISGKQEKKILSPKEISRRHRKFTLFSQLYFPRSWIDILFLKELAKNKDLMLPQSNKSRPILENLTKSKEIVVKKLMKMLNHRCPLYTKMSQSYPNKTMKAKQTEQFLTRTQYQVHRNMLQILSRMNFLRKERKLQKLRCNVEEILGDYVILKTHRIMPLKFQFINEICNILALTEVDKLINIQENFIDVHQSNRLDVIFGLPDDSLKEPIVPVFGNRATYPSPDEKDKEWLKNENLSTRLKRRLQHANYPIEKAYLWYEIARCDLIQHRFDECNLNAEKSILEAKKCNSYIWEYNAIILLCKLNIMQKKIEKVSEKLLRAVKTAKFLKSQELMNFLNICTELNDTDIKIKKYAEAARSRSKISMFSKRGSSRSDDSG